MLHNRLDTYVLSGFMSSPFVNKAGARQIEIVQKNKSRDCSQSIFIRWYHTNYLMKLHNALKM